MRCAREWIRRIAMYLPPLAIVMAQLGCAYSPKDRITSDAGAINLAVEESTNRMLLINVLRAMHRRPMVFTSINVGRGSLSTELTTGDITVPFGSGSDKKYSIAPKATFSTNPSYDVAVMDTQEFYQGILSPVSLETVKYFIDQGWPAEMLLMLFIRRIDIGDERPVSFVNTPTVPEELWGFQRAARLLFSCADRARGHFVECSFRLDQTPSLVWSGPFSTLENIPAFDAAGYSLTIPRRSEWTTQDKDSADPIVEMRRPLASARLALM